MSRLPTVKPSEMVRLLKRAGFVEVRQKGSHLYLWHQQQDRLTSVPMHPGDLSRVTMKAILKQAVLTEEQFRDLL